MPQVVSSEPPADLDALQKYYKIQVKAWTAFDPADMELGEIAARIQLGSGVITAIEVTRVANELGSIDDESVRNQFQMLIAIEQIIQNAAGLPPSIRNRLIEALAEVPVGHNPQHRVER